MTNDEIITQLEQGNLRIEHHGKQMYHILKDIIDKMDLEPESLFAMGFRFGARSENERLLDAVKRMREIDKHPWEQEEPL